MQKEKYQENLREKGTDSQRRREKKERERRILAGLK
jgi:hypothetical protein